MTSFSGCVWQINGKWGIEKSVDTQCCARGNQLQCLFWGYLGGGSLSHNQSDK